MQRLQGLKGLELDLERGLLELEWWDCWGYELEGVEGVEGGGWLGLEKLGLP